MKTINIGYGTLTLRDDGIMHLIISEVIEAEISHIQKAIDAMKELGNGEKFPFLAESVLFTTITMEARKFLAEKNSNPYSTKEAFLVNTLPKKLLANFYLNFDKPGRPPRIFQDRDEAIKWLLKP